MSLCVSAYLSVRVGAVCVFQPIFLPIIYRQTLADTKERLTTAHRTCDLIFGFGDAKSNQVTLFDRGTY
jgi:hypothetical protein